KTPPNKFYFFRTCFYMFVSNYNFSSKQSIFDIEAMLQISYQQQSVIRLQVERIAGKINSVIGTIIGVTERLAGICTLNGELLSLEIQIIRNVQFC
ncbi:hypothetical protein, partial [Paucilactobacillus kaifaensis]|uniref:hypothetical protein n=1 Tax=Paucilactobacillus kaifaensis TaxID=2559921 RepID=UPI001CC812B7